MNFEDFPGNTYTASLPELLTAHSKMRVRPINHKGGIKMENWETDPEIMKDQSFIKFKEGRNIVELASDGEKVRGQFGVSVEFRTKEGMILSLKPSPILRVIGDYKKEHGTVVGRRLYVTRTGTGKEDTKYTDIRLE